MKRVKALLFGYSWDTKRATQYHLDAVGTMKGFCILFRYSSVIHYYLDTVGTMKGLCNIICMQLEQ